MDNMLIQTSKCFACVTGLATYQEWDRQYPQTWNNISTMPRPKPPVTNNAITRVNGTDLCAEHAFDLVKINEGNWRRVMTNEAIY